MLNATLVSLNKQVTTPAGTFNNCIEVTEEVTFNSQEKVINLKYYAPKIGLVQQKTKTINSDFILSKQLTAYISQSNNANASNQNFNATTSNLDSSKEWVKARHILVKTEQLAKEKSIDPSAKQNGGELGYFTKDQMVPEFSNAAFSQKVGTFSQEPVKTAFGYHIIFVEDHKYPNNSTNSNSGPTSDKVPTADNNLPAINYTNTNYGFSLEIPGWWNGKYSVREGDWNNYGAKVIGVNLVSNGKEFYVFGVVVLKGQRSKGDLSGYYSSLGSNGNYTYALEFCENQELLLPQYKQELATYQKMADNLGGIAKSFKFIK